MTDLNTHFVSRFLTRPWEHGQRYLTYFDFAERRMGIASSRRLFAVRGGNTREVEQRLDRLIETPIAAAMAILAAPAAAADGQQALDWPLFRALSLLMMLQPLRAPGDAARNATLEQTVVMTDTELDAIATAAGRAYHLGRITVQPGAALLYPAAGFFPIVAQDDDGNWRSCVAIPIAQQQVFVAAPRAVDWDRASAMWAQNGAGMLSNFSVGSSDRVVLPPAHVAEYTEEEITELVTEMRTANTRLINLCGDMNDALARLNEM